jgi:hypothetical protein
MRKRSRAASKDWSQTWVFGEFLEGERELDEKGKATLAESSEKENARVWTKEVDLMDY